MIRVSPPPSRSLVRRSASASAIEAREPFPARLGQYQLLRRVGEGGMALVHLAAAPDGRLVAVKALRYPLAGDEDSRCRFGREVEAMCRVRSPFVTDVLDADLTGEHPYLVTRFVPGRSLAKAVADRGPLHGHALQRVAYGLAEALTAIHAAGIVHRDLKPGNVMLNCGEPVVIDFGIAYQAGDEPLTQTGVYLGTSGYLAPEVIEGKRGGAPADVHAWGATVGYAARGIPVYGTGTLEVVSNRIVRSDADLEGIHGALYPLVAASLLRQPGQRPSAAWLAGEAARLDLEAPAPAPTSTPQTPGSCGTVTKSLAPVPRAPVRQETGYESPDDVADLLPAFRYGPVAGSVPPDSAARQLRPHRLLALLVLVMAVGLSLLQPLAGIITVAVLLTLLRTAGRARRGLATRRAVRGLRTRDPFVLTASIPWSLVRSVVETAVVGLLLLAAAVAVTTAAPVADRSARILPAGARILTVAGHDVRGLPAGAVVAALFTVFSCLGPRSRLARRELNRAFNAVATTPLTAATTLLTLAGLGVAIAYFVLLKAPAPWHVPSLHSFQLHLPGVGPASKPG